MVLKSNIFLKKVAKTNRDTKSKNGRNQIVNTDYISKKP
jgi:hypothetical protein